MNELLKVNYENERITLSARDLHKFLEITERFSNWFERMNQYGFQEQIDYLGRKVFNAQAHQELQDYEITLDMAKEIAMIQRNEKGKQARSYFLELEKKWNSPEAVMNRALEYSRKQVKALMEENQTLKPKAIFADAVSASEESILVGQLAKLIKQNGYDIGQNKLFEYLRNNNYLIKSGTRKNQPTQKSMEMKLFEVKERAVTNPDGSTRLTLTTKVTGKGQVYFINKFLNKEINTQMKYKENNL